MIVIDPTYFEGEIYLPMLQNCSGYSESIQTLNTQRLEWFINKYEYVYLVKLLGKSLTEKFISEIKNNSPDQMWVDIKNHLIFQNDSFKASPIANYCYYRVIRNSSSITSMKGEERAKSDYSDSVSANPKLINAYNNMCAMTLSFLNWFNPDTYKEYMTNLSGMDLCEITEMINSFNI